MRKAIQFEDGTVAIASDSNVWLEKNDASGKPVKIKRVFRIGNVTDKEFEEIRKDYRKFNESRFGVEDVTKDDMKRLMEAKGGRK